MSDESDREIDPKETVKKRSRTVIGKFIYYGLLGVGLIILSYMITTSGAFENWTIYARISIPLFAAAFILTNLNILMKVARWKYLCTSYKAPVRWKDAWKIVVGSFFFSGISPGKIGDMIKAYVMKNRYSLPLSSGVSMILYERVFELVMVFLVSLGILFIGLSARYYLILQISLFVLIFLGVAYVFSDKATSLLQKILKKIPIVRWEDDEFRIRKLPLPGAMVVFILTGTALGFEFVRLWTVALAFGYKLNIIHLSIFFSLSVLIGLISQIPIGIGVVEGSLTLFLTEAGIPFEYAFAIVIVDRLISMYYVVLLGLVYYKWSLSPDRSVTA